jgi:hypothetical protein
VPSIVEANDGQSTHKVQLSERFQELIDLVAMRRGLGDTDAYLMEWRKEPPQQREGSAKEAATALAAEIENRYEEIKATAIARSASGT